MAHMELAIKHGLNVNLGDVIYYVNNGVKASDGDVQKVSKTGIKENPTKDDMKKYISKNGWTEGHGTDNWLPPGNNNDWSSVSLEEVYETAIKTDVKINCYLLDPKTLEQNENLTGEYNAARAITTFNKRIEPLLIVFDDEVRNNLLVDNPEKRGLFTRAQCELINGKPFEEGDQDTIEELLTISDGEIKFWNKVNMDPNYIYKLAQPGWEEKIST